MRLATTVRQAAGGFALITAIFLLVVFGALATMMLTFFNAQQQASALDITGSAAYQAARTGIEWAALGVNAVPAGTLWAGCATGTMIAVNRLSGVLAPYQVKVSCSSVTANDGGIIYYVYTISSVSSGPNGAAPGSTDYVSRSITARMAN